MISLTELPIELLDCPANQLHTKISNHTLCTVKGKIERPLFVSVLQHGDETTGWDVMRQFLKNHRNNLPRTIIIYFGNIEAAAANQRLIDGQFDFNRCWPGQHQQDNETAHKLAKVTALIKDMSPFASVDIHNNSGRNPHYAGINDLGAEFVNLASLFSNTIIHFTSPDGIQSGAFAHFCPSVTLECGMAGTADGTEQTITFLENLIHLPNLKQVPGVAEHQEVLNIFSTVKIKKNMPFSVAEANNGAAFVVEKDLDRHNFHLLAAGTTFGTLTHNHIEMPFEVTDAQGNNLTDQFFTIQDSQVVLKQAVMPAMITQSERAIKLDCLCYLMRPLDQNNEQHSEPKLRETS